MSNIYSDNRFNDRIHFGTNEKEPIIRYILQRNSMWPVTFLFTIARVFKIEKFLRLKQTIYNNHVKREWLYSTKLLQVEPIFLWV
jgi:hypothetical protein